MKRARKILQMLRPHSPHIKKEAENVKVRRKVDITTKNETNSENNQKGEVEDQPEESSKEDLENHQNCEVVDQPEVSTNNDLENYQNCGVKDQPEVSPNEDLENYKKREVMVRHEVSANNDLENDQNCEVVDRPEVSPNKGKNHSENEQTCDILNEPGAATIEDEIQPSNYCDLWNKPELSKNKDLENHQNCEVVDRPEVSDNIDLENHQNCEVVDQPEVSTNNGGNSSESGLAGDISNEPGIYATKGRKRKNCTTVSYREEKDGPELMEFSCSDDSDFEIEMENDRPKKKRFCQQKRKWSKAEKFTIFKVFGKHILNNTFPGRQAIRKMFLQNKIIFDERSFESVYLYVNNLTKRKQNNVSPMIKKYISTHSSR